MHFYFADAAPILLDMSVCIVFTATVMKFFYRRDHQQRGGTVVQEQPQNEVGNEDHKDEEEEKAFDCFEETLRQLNLILIAAVGMGCEFF